MFATKEGYTCPLRFASALAAAFFAGASFLGAPKDFGRAFSHTGLFEVAMA